MKVSFDPISGHILAHFSTVVRIITGPVAYAMAQWLYAHDDGEPYEITGEQGTFRMTIAKVEPEGVPYA